MKRFKNILFFADGTMHPGPALERAVTLADYNLSSRDPRVHLLEGNPPSRIQSLTKDLKADLVVMGTVGRTGIPGFIIDNTAEEVLQTTTASVLAVKPAGLISPVTTSGTA